MNLLEIDKGQDASPGRPRSRPGFRPREVGYDGDFLDGKGGYRNQTGPGREQSMDVGSPSSIMAGARKAPRGPEDRDGRDPLEEGQTVHGPGSVDWQTEKDIQAR